MPDGTMRSAHEFQRGIAGAWLVVTLISLAAVLAPHVLPPEFIAVITPVCEAKLRHGRTCILCGMTTSFIEIALGNWDASFRANRGGLILYSLFLLNSAGALVWIASRRERNDS
jgi:hypothetical protein